MFKRLLFLLVMMAVVGLPYLATSSSDWLSSFGLGSSGAAANGKAKAQGFQTTAPSARGGETKTDPFGKPTGPVEGFSAQDLGEVLQFEGTPAWVMTRWPRVTAGLAELDLQGYRVPLVTGTAEDDLAGSLTYYFDKNQHIEFINFHGTTGDPRKLIALVTSRYKFLRQTTEDPSLHLYQVKWNGKALSELRVRPARVVRADQPHARYEVDLAMKRP
ncbi:MAG TPA: DUF6690 family protein [Pirellulales bacterium]|jgi:hypothetical protein|nr:DUF6690 family protein [Pirellulales bacterium]